MLATERRPESVDVLVVGAGPVGLFAALCASQGGLEVMVLDHVSRGFGQGHASLLHSTVLDLLDRAGVADVLRAEGRSIERLELQMDGDANATFELPAAALAVSQAALEQVLIDALRARGVHVQAPYQAATIEHDATHVNVRVLQRELVTLGSPAHYSEWQAVDSSVIHAAFVIGADGYESRVRSALGIEVVEVSPPETFAMFECSRQTEVAPTVRFSLGALGTVGYPLSGTRSRWGFQLDRGLDRLPESPLLKELLADRAPEHVDDADHLEWGAVMHFERRLTRRFGKGRAWLAGDAAHVTSPFGSQSLNVGLAEAHDLIARILESRRTNTTSELDDYGAERLREWHKLLGVNVSFELLAHAPPWLAKHVRQLVPALPLSGAALTVFLEQLGVRLS